MNCSLRGTRKHPLPTQTATGAWPVSPWCSLGANCHTRRKTSCNLGKVGMERKFSALTFSVIPEAAQFIGNYQKISRLDTFLFQRKVQAEKYRAKAQPAFEGCLKASKKKLDIRERLAASYTFCLCCQQNYCGRQDGSSALPAICVACLDSQNLWWTDLWQSHLYLLPVVQVTDLLRLDKSLDPWTVMTLSIVNKDRIKISLPWHLLSDT